MLDLSGDWDVVSFDSVGTPFDGFSPGLMGLGGSEWQDILVLEGLAERGLKVMSVNRLQAPAIHNKVMYVPIGLAVPEGGDELRCKTLILNRNSPMPQLIKPERILIRATDVYSEWGGMDAHLPLFDDFDTKLIPVSNWQAQAFPDSFKRRQVVYNMLPDALYKANRKLPRNAPAHSFIYASAALKGLQETINYFAEMVKSGHFKSPTLTVCCPAYSVPQAIQGKHSESINFKGSLPFNKLIKTYQECRSLLHISTFKETFGLAHVMAEVLGLNLFVLQASGEDALSEVCSKGMTTNLRAFNLQMNKFSEAPQEFEVIEPRDFRASRILEQWMELVK